MGEAFFAVFDDNYADIWAFIRRRVHSAVDADDLTAEVFATAWRRVGELPREEERRPWLFGVARNVMRNHRRSITRRERLQGKLIRSLPTQPDSNSGSSLDGELWIALAKLSDGDRDLLLMRSWDQLAVTEIAIILQCSPNAVSSRLRKARIRLKEHLDQTDLAHGGDAGVEPTRTDLIGSARIETREGSPE